MSPTRNDPRTATQVEVGEAVKDGAPSDAPPDALEEAWHTVRAASAVDPRVFTGAFGPRVWGGRYEMDGVLGRGGQGTTFVGTDRKTGARVAVKLFELGRAKEWKSRELFDREAHTLQTIEHPGMPVFLDVIDDESTGARALVMTHVPGDALDVVSRRDGPLPEAQLWRILVDVSDVLGALHGASNPVVHRDVKPANLIRRPDGTTAIVDFGGVGRARGAAGSTVVGTFGYMAPEQLYGNQSPATDLYALGATLLTLATGKEPEDQPRKGLAIDVDAAAPHLSRELRALLARLLAPEPAARPKDALALSHELHANTRAAKSVEPDVVDAPREHLDLPPPFAVLMMIVGMLGVAGSVVFGQLLIPLFLTIAGALSPPHQRRRFYELRDTIRSASQTSQQHFFELRDRGQTALEQLEDDERHRTSSRHNRRREKQEEARLRHEAARARQRELRDAQRARHRGASDRRR